MGFWYMYFETYMQDACEDLNFMDTHVTVFCIKRRNVKKLLKKLGFPKLKEFLKECTYDWTDQLYMAAKEAGLIEDEFIEGGL